MSGEPLREPAVADWWQGCAMGLSVGVDVGGTKIAAGVVDEAGVILDQVRVPTPADDPAKLRATIAELAGELAGRHDVKAVGIGAAGFVNAERTALFFSAHVSWGTEPVTDILQDSLGLPVTVENDGNAAAWAEYVYGAGQGVPDQLMVALGTGVGGGLILRGEIYRGGHGVAGEIGHLGLVPHGRPCECGRNGCLEEYASGSSLQRMAQEAAADGSAPVLLAAADGDPTAVTGAQVTELAEAGEPEALELFDKLAAPLGIGISSLVSILDPSVVILGGGVSDAGELLLGPTRAAVERELSGRGRRPSPEVRLAALGNDAGLIGAADLARLATS
jgi:glucokinase